VNLFEASKQDFLGYFSLYFDPPLKIRGYAVIRKLTSGQYRLYSREKGPKTGKRRNLGTLGTRKEAEEHEQAVQYFKRHG